MIYFGEEALKATQMIWVCLVYLAVCFHIFISDDLRKQGGCKQETGRNSDLLVKEAEGRGVWLSEEVTQ